MGITDHLTCLLRNQYVGQEATVRTLYGTTDWFKIEKEVWQVCLLLPYLFNLYAEHIMRNARLNELQASIKTGGKIIKNLRYTDDTTLMKENKGISEKTSLCFIDYTKAFDSIDHDKLWKALREMGIPDHLPVSCETCMWV